VLAAPVGAGGALSHRGLDRGAAFGVVHQRVWADAEYFPDGGAWSGGEPDAEGAAEFGFRGAFVGDAGGDGGLVERLAVQRQPLLAATAIGGADLGGDDDVGVQLGVFLAGHAMVVDHCGQPVSVDLHDPVSAPPGERPVLAQVRHRRAHAGVVGGHHRRLHAVVAERPQQRNAFHRRHGDVEPGHRPTLRHGPNIEPHFRDLLVRRVIR
jgi:hypothetical protein